MFIAFDREALRGNVRNLPNAQNQNHFHSQVSCFVVPDDWPPSSRKVYMDVFSYDLYFQIFNGRNNCKRSVGSD